MFWLPFSQEGFIPPAPTKEQLDVVVEGQNNLSKKKTNKIQEKLPFSAFFSSVFPVGCGSTRVRNAQVPSCKLWKAGMWCDRFGSIVTVPNFTCRHMRFVPVMCNCFFFENW